MTAFTWAGGSSANWADPGNWSAPGHPGATGDTVLIDAAGTYTVSVASGETDTIDSLTLDAPDATLSVNGTLAFGGANSLSIAAGTLSLGSTGNITGSPDVTVAAGATLDISGGTDQTIGSLSGSGLVVVGTHNLTIGGDNTSTTFSGTVQGGAGFDQGALIHVGTGTLMLDNATMTNNELIIGTGNLAVGEGTSQIFYLALGEGTGNSGSATISGGVLNIGGTSPATLRSALLIGDFGGTGLFTQTGGTVNVTGSFNVGNQGGTGTYDLIDGTLNLVGTGIYDIGRNGTTNPAGSGTVNVSGGLLDISGGGTFVLGNLYPNGGTLGQSSGLMVQTGGIVRIESGSAIYMASLGNGEYHLDGGMLQVGGTGLRNHYQGGGGTGTFHMGGGTLAVTGADLTTDVQLVLDSATDSTLSLGGLNASFSGTVTGAGDLDISGTGTAAFSTLGGTGTVTIGAGSILSVAGAVGAGQTIAFGDPSGTLSLGAPGSFAGTIAGFGAGGHIDLTAIGFSAAGHVDLIGGNLLRITENGHTYDLQLNPSQDFAGDFFHLAGDGNGGTMITEDTTPCYGRGTLIRTADGEVAIENLRIGHYIITIEGESLPLKWIGRRSYRDWQAVGNPEVQPVCFKAGSIADGVPVRDLYVSPEHAMFLDGVLVPARHLVNGTSILQVEGMDEIDYFHLEFDRHAVIFAEGAKAESFVDDDSRARFHNAAEYRRLYPNEPRTHHVEFCAPRVEDGAALEVIRRTLANRAAHLRPGMGRRGWTGMAVLASLAATHRGGIFAA